MRICGIDPGLTGALAVLEGGRILAVEDMPCLDGQADAAAINTFLGIWTPDTIVIEQVQPMPKVGTIASFKLGMNYGVVLGVIGTLPHPLIKMKPMEWKKLSGLIRKPKEASRRLAMELWPTDVDLFKRVKDDGRAEAALIARAGMSRMVWEANHD